MLSPITRRQILDYSKLKEFADDSLKFDENGRKLSKLVENTVGKGEIPCYEQFLLFPQCFQKVFSQGRQKESLCGNGSNSCHPQGHENQGLFISPLPHNFKFQFPCRAP